MVYLLKQSNCIILKTSDYIVKTITTIVCGCTKADSVPGLGPDVDQASPCGVHSCTVAVGPVFCLVYFRSVVGEEGVVVIIVVNTGTETE